jgi:hypothetical protein
MVYISRDAITRSTFLAPASQGFAATGGPGLSSLDHVFACMFLFSGAMLLTSLVALAAATVVSAALPGDQAAAVVALYHSCGGPSWLQNTSWLVGDPCDNRWYGIYCDESGSSVVAVQVRW